MSALDVWLRDTESIASSAATPAAPGDGPPAASELATPTPRDMAEALLDLQVWITADSGNDAAVASRQLATADQAPERVDALAAQLWAQHVIAPLEPKV
jgi:hypothetical protein